MAESSTSQSSGGGQFDGDTSTGLRTRGHASHRRRREAARRFPQQQVEPEATLEERYPGYMPDYQHEVYESEEEQAGMAGFPDPHGMAEQQQHLDGPPDRSLLTGFDGHIAAKILKGERVRGKLKVASHGTNLKKASLLVDNNPAVAQWIAVSGLGMLAKTSLFTIDHQLLSALIERWHPETSSFHLAFGEMTITLDDVCCLLHLPLNGNLYPPPSPPVSTDRGIQLAVDFLGCTESSVVAETRVSKGPYLRHEFLMDLIEEKIERGEHLFAARAYLLFVLGSTLFSSKMFNRVECKWLLLLEDLQACQTWAWGPAALAFIYSQLNDASCWNTKQFGGYASLLTCWIYEYFPTLCLRKDKGAVEGPRATRWARKKDDAANLTTYRKRLDALTVHEVIWRPFEDHRQHIQFHVQSLYRGFILWGDIIVGYMPDRCMRQFGYVQSIPVGALAGRPSTRDILLMWHQWTHSVQQILAGAQPVAEPFQHDERYLPWYYRVSVPRLFDRYDFDDEDAAQAQPPPAQPEVPPVQPQAPHAQPHAHVAQPDPYQRLDDIAERLRDVLRRGHIPPTSEDYATIWSALEIAQWGDY